MSTGSALISLIASRQNLDDYQDAGPARSANISILSSASHRSLVRPTSGSTT